MTGRCPLEDGGRGWTSWRSLYRCGGESIEKRMGLRGYTPVLAQDAGGCDAVRGMIPPDMSLEIMPPLELTTTVKKSE